MISGILANGSATASCAECLMTRTIYLKFIRRWKQAWHLPLLLGLACVPLHALADTLVGRVVKIADGDTITLLTESKSEQRVRLAGIDAPESHQAFGSKSKSNLSAMVFDQYVTVEYSKHDRYNRIVGKVLAAAPGSSCQFNEKCSRTVDVNLEQVKSGMAWWYRHYADEQPAEDRSRYEAAEFQAKAMRNGLWSDTNPVPPWDFRRKRL